MLNEIKESTDIYKYLKRNTSHLDRPDFSSYLNQLFDIKNIKKTQFLFITGLTRSYVYAILKGEKKPSRDKLIIMIFGLSCNLEEAYNMLQYAGHQPLYARDLRDTVLLFGIKQKMPLYEVNDILYDLNLPIID